MRDYKSLEKKTMYNNITKTKNVNNEKQNFLTNLHNFFHALTPNAEYWEKDGENWKPIKKLFSFEQDRCNAGVNTVATLYPVIKKDRTGAFKKSFQEWKWVRDILAKRPLTDEELKIGLKQIEKEISVFSMNINGTNRHFESNAKGTERYNKKKSYQAMDYIKNHCDGQWESLFLTLTCSVKQYSSIAESWELYDKQEIKPVLENLRKHHGCEYIRVIESFENQHPHTHIVLFFPKGSINGWEKMQNQQQIKYGWLYDFIKSRVFSPVFRLECAKGDNLKYYLTKYILKGNFDTLSTLSKKEGNFTKTERKTACELVFLKAFRKHTIEKCKDRSATAIKAREEEKKVTVLAQKKAEEKREKLTFSADVQNLNATQLRSYLTSLCINSPFNCNNCIKMMSLKHYRETFGQVPNKDKEISDDDEKKFSSQCSSIGCGGCFYSEFVKFVYNWDNSKINRKFYWDKKNNIYDNFCDAYDFNNDESYIACITAVVDFYFKSMYINANSFDDIIECREDVARYWVDKYCTLIDKKKLSKWVTLEKAVAFGFDWKRIGKNLRLFR